MVCGFVTCIVGLTLMGPSTLLRLPDNLYIMAIGTSIIGINAQVLGIATVLYTRGALKRAFPSHDDSISKLIGSARAVTSGMAFTLSPLYASTMQKFFGFGVLCDSLSLITLVFLLAFALSVLYNNRKTPSSLADLDEPLLGSIQSASD